ncbi:MAG: hypothetical protein QXJ28_00940, partial [Candidatus Pacearchaeota archaeon]
FSNFFMRWCSKYFDIIRYEFEYYGEKRAEAFYILKERKNAIIGPKIELKEAVEKFKRAHKIWYIEGGRIKSPNEKEIKANNILKYFKKENSKAIKSMGISKIRIEFRYFS